MTYTRKILALFVILCLPAISYGQPATKLTASDGTNGDWFGSSAWLNGNDLVIGARLAAGGGTAYIFTHDGVTWTEQAKLTASDASAGDEFGGAAAIDGDYAVISAYLSDAHGVDAGQAYVFKRTGTVWQEEARLAATDIASGDQFGVSVAIQGAYIIVGSRNHGGAGAAYVFKRNGPVWDQQAKLVAAPAVNGDEFGGAVSIDGDYIIAGALERFTGGTGSAYIFKRTGSTWDEQAHLTPSDATSSIQFGRSVSISGDYAIAGTRFSSAAYVYERNGTAWNEQVKLTPSGTSTSGIFGFSVFLRGDRLVVGDPHEFENGSFAGKAYVYDRNGAAWAETAILVSTNPTPSDEFGYAVSIDEEVVLVSALTADQEKGAAYVFQAPPPNQPPVANAGPDQTIECANPGGTLVLLDGIASSDPDGDALIFTWTGSFPEGGGSVNGATPTVTLPLGIHTITLTVDDGNGGTDTDEVVITVQDTTPPEVTAELVPVPGGGGSDDDDDDSYAAKGAGTDDDDGDGGSDDDFTVECTGTDNCDANPTITSIIVTPTIQNPTLRFSMRNRKKLIFDLDRDRITIQGPNPQAFWAQVQADGGVAVAKGQALILVGGEDDDDDDGDSGGRIIYRFNSIGDLTTVEGSTAVLRCTATDTSGNTASAEATPPAPSGSGDDDDDDSFIARQGNDAAKTLDVVAQEAVPESYSLDANYPNPFNPTTQIRFGLPEAARVRLVIYDLLGRQVHVLVDGVREAGRHEVVFTADHLPSGVYFYQLWTDSFTQTRHMVLTK